MRSPEPIIVPRQPLAIVAVVIAVLFLGASIFALVKGYGSEKPASPEAIQTIDPMTGEPTTAIKAPVRYQSEFTLGGVAGLFCAIASGVCAFWVFTRPINPDARRQQAEDRLALLTFGGILGAVIMLLGAALLFVWFGDLTAWLNKEDKVKVWKPLTALLIFLVGAGVMFLAAQPARGDERNSTPVRRAVYGVNLALSAVLVFALLLVLNIVVGLKLPARFDTTETGLYTISDGTREYLQQLKEDITIYNTVPEERRGTDVARLLGSFRDANPQRIRVKRLSQDLDKTEIADLKAKFKSTDMTNPIDGSIRYGLLFTVGTDESKASFLGDDVLFTRTQGQRGAPGRLEFAGESRVAREILFLTESKSKAVIYFTQSAGEISIAGRPDANAPSQRTGEQLKTGLVANGNDVRPLVFDPAQGEPKIPDDATLVIIADPLTTLAPATVNALNRYMRVKRPDGTQGKLVLLAGAHAQPGSGGVLKIGLEELLDSFGIFIRPLVAYGEPTERSEPNEFLVAVNPNLAKDGNSIALAYKNAAFPVADVRPVALKPKGEATGKTDPFLFTIEDRLTWFETSVQSNPRQAFLSLRTAFEGRNLAYIKQRDAITGNGEPISVRIVGALASEPDESGKVTNRIAVIGFGSFFEDKPGQGGSQADFLSATVNWLRDRPAIANESNKPYGVYEPNKKMKWNQVFWLPVTVTLIGLGGMGLGLWAWRRK